METTIAMSRKGMPLVIRGIVICAVLLIALHLGTIGVTITEYGSLVSKIMNAARETTPTLTEAQLYAVGKWITILGIAYSVVEIIVYAWLMRALYMRRHWARIALTVFIVANFILSLYTFGTTPLPLLLGITIASWLLQIGLIALLWIPDTTEEYFER
jgi:hypothetical protein